MSFPEEDAKSTNRLEAQQKQSNKNKAAINLEGLLPKQHLS